MSPLKTGNLDPYRNGTNLYFPCSLDDIPSIVQSYKNKNEIQRVYIPDSVTSIQKQAFYDYKNLTKVIMSDASKLQSIGDRVFQGCKNLNFISTLYKIKYIGQGAFQQCSSLRSINISSNQYKTIQKQTFLACTSLQYVYLTNYVESIYDNAFELNLKLTEFEAPLGLKYIAPNAFSSCFNLECVWLPPGCEYENAFPDSVLEGDFRIGGNKCSSHVVEPEENPDTSDIPDQTNNNGGMIAGIVVAVIVVIAIVVVVAVLLIRKKNQQKQSGNEMQGQQVVSIRA